MKVTKSLQYTYLNPGVSTDGSAWGHASDDESVDAALLNVHLDAQLVAVFQNLDVLQSNMNVIVRFQQFPVVKDSS